MQGQFILQETPCLERFDLNKFWFYLDEVSSETTEMRGPVSREELRDLVDKGREVNYMCYVWHPALGTQWLPLEKVKEILTPPEGKTDEVIHTECESRLQMKKYPLPHLRGYLKVGFKGKISTKWVVILGHFLHFSNCNTDPTHELTVDLQECDFDLLDLGVTLTIKITSTCGELCLNSPSERGSEEALEWFIQLRCARSMALALGDELPEPVVDLSELHITNVRNSADYMGEKMMEGFLKKEGSVWRVVHSRWFVLRTQGLYYYTRKGDKSYKGKFSLKGVQIESHKMYKYPHHFGVIMGKKTLNLWADCFAMKEIWMTAIEKAVRKLHVS